MKSPRVVLAVLAVMLLGAVSACGSGGATEKKAGAATLTVAATQAWTGFNPYHPDQGIAIGIALANAVYPSAFQVQPDQTVSLNKDLLESATVTSQEPQTVTYKIKAGAAWSDGTPITADDFIYLWQHLNGSNEKLQVTTALGYKQISSVKAAGDPKTVEVAFNSPFADWQSLFAPLLPAHHMKTLGSDEEAWNRGLVDKSGPSGGPYQVAETKEGQYILLKSNPKWYGKKPAIGTVTVRQFSDDQSAVQALANGEIDYAWGLRPSHALVGQLKALSTVTTEVTPSTNQQFLNTQFSRPATGDLAVRRAIATAVDPEKVAQTVFGGDVSDLLTTHHIFAPTSPHYTDNRPAGYGSGDTAAAATILEEAGYGKGADGIYAKGGKKLEIKYLVGSQDQLANQAGVIIQDQLKKAGIKVNLASVPAADYFPTMTAAEYDMALGNYPASSFPVSWYGALYPCKGGFNFAEYCNDKVDKDYNQAYGTLDPKAQAELINRVDKQLWADIANIPMWEVPQLAAYAAKVKGVQAELPKENQLLAISGWTVG